jgi:hypothetical protein
VGLVFCAFAALIGWGTVLDENSWWLPRVAGLLFAVIFLAVGLPLLLSPLLHNLQQRTRTYAVTTRRALVVGPFANRVWTPRRIFPPDRADHPSGLTDIWFARGDTAIGGHWHLAGFQDLPSALAPAACAALARLRAPLPPPATARLAPVRYPDLAAQARVEAVLDLGETPLWAGRPARRLRPALQCMTAGLLWALFASAFLAAVLYAAATRDLPLAALLVAHSIILPNLFCGLWFALSPLRRPLYAVTTQRALVLGRFSCSAWRASELRPLVRKKHPDGTADLLFARNETGGRGGRPQKCGFSDLPLAHLPAATAALLALSRRPA